MKRKATVIRLLTVLLGCIILVAIVEVGAKSNGVSGYSQSGATCHSGTADPSVTVTITGIPASYIPGTNYNLQVTVTGGPAGVGGGFDLSVTAGTLTTTDPNALIKNGEATNANGNVRTWSVRWQAPAAGTGTVTFYVSGLSSNDDGKTTGDGWNVAIYTSNESSPNQRPAISLTNPTGTQDWTGGSSQTITWTMSDDITPTANLKVYLNYTSSAGSGPIAGPLTGATSFAWTVPTINANDAAVNATVIDGGGLKGYSQILVPTIDSTRPTVLSATPTGTGVAVGAPIVIQFSEQMNRAATQAALSLSPDPGGWTYAWSQTSVPDDTLTANHASFAGATVHTATLGVGAKDVSSPGNALAAPYQWTFTTVVVNSPPTISLTAPTAGVSWTGGSSHNIIWTANDAEDPIGSLKVWVNYSITGGAPFNGQVAGLQGVSASLSPFAWTVPLEDSVSVILNATIMDTGGARGRALSPLFEIDSTPPTVSLVSPLAGAINVPTGANIMVTWSEPMNGASAESAFSLKDTVTWTAVPGAFSWVGNTMTFNPTSLLQPSRQHSANITVAATDDSLPGNSLAAIYVWTFTTAAGADTLPPQLSSLSAVPDPQEVFLPVNVSLEVQDDVAVGEVWLNVTDVLGGWINTTMPLDGISARYYVERGYSVLGLHTAVVWAADTSGNWNSMSVQFTIQDTTPPVANAGPDQTVPQNTLVTFDGSGSTDNVGIENYTWTFTDGGARTLYGVTPQYRFLNVASIPVTLTVRDFDGNTATDQMLVTVTDATPPVADAGPDQTINVGGSANFDGRGSTDNVGIDSYTWTFTDGAPVTLVGSQASHTFNTAGDYIVTLTVEDEAGLQDQDTMVVHVLASGGDLPPEAPLNLVVQSAGADALRLTWNANTESDLGGYRVYRSLSPGGPYVSLNPATLVTGTTYLDEHLEGGHTYYYVVTAIDNGQHESNRSNEASGYVAPLSGPASEAPVDDRWMLVLLLAYGLIVLIGLLIFLGQKRKNKRDDDSPQESVTQKEMK